jgi:hypothetical protein
MYNCPQVLVQVTNVIARLYCEDNIMQEPMFKLWTPHFLNV